MNATQEQWRPVHGFEGFYEVSDQGRVRSIDRVIHASDNRNGYFRPGVIRKTWIDRDGYHHVNLTMATGTGSIRRKRTVHTLVLEAFVGPASGTATVACHDDGDPGNNRLTNLRWGTAEANMQDRLRHGRNPNANKTHCKRGHEFTPENTWRHNGARYCRECKRVAYRRWRQRQRAA